MSDTETLLNTDFKEWFERLQELSAIDLNDADWVGRWFDGYSPQEALDDGPEAD